MAGATMERNPDHWQARLPQELVDHVIWPVRIEAHHDAGVPASKWRGYDVLGVLCYYRHLFAQWDASLDGEDDEAVIQLLREEDFEAWRTMPGTWVRRIQRIDGDGRDDGLARDGGFEQVEASAIPRM
jgi:hypothetical protein